MAPLFGDTYHRAQQANSKDEFFKSKEAQTAAVTWGSSLLGSAVQTYGVGALINATGTLSYKGAAYLGSLIFMASAAPSVRPCLFLLGSIVKRHANQLGSSSSRSFSPRSVLSISSLWA